MGHRARGGGLGRVRSLRPEETMREPRLYSYLDERSGPLPDYLLEVERRTHLRTLQPQMLCGHMQGRFLSWLVGWLRPLVSGRPFRILEVGTFTGYSALCFAERLTPGDEVHTIEIDDEREALIREHFALAGYDGGEGQPRLHLHVADANALLPELPGPWDLVFLDARKDDYPTQFAAAAERLAPGGLVLLDNVLWDGQVLDEGNRRPTVRLLRDFTLALARNPRYETLALPMSDGLLLVRRR